MVSGIAIATLMVLTVVDVIFRESGHLGISGVIELTEVVLVVVVVIGLMSAEINQTHIRTQLVTSRLSQVVGDSVRSVGYFLSAIFTTWTTFATLETGWVAFRLREIRPGLAEIPIWPAKIFIPIGFAGLTLVLLAKCYVYARAALTNRTAPDPVRITDV